MTRKVTVDQIASTQDKSKQLVAKMADVIQNVRNRAYELFDGRGREDGHDLEDWLQAEDELGVLPVANIEETATEIRLRIERADFSPDQLEIHAEPEAITVEGSEVKSVDSDDHQQTSLTERTLFGRYELPAVIDTASATATLNSGVLEIVANKAGSTARRSVEVDVDKRPLRSKPQKEKSVAV